MQLFSADATIYLKISKFFLPTKSWKNHPQKLLRIPQIHFFSLLLWLPKGHNRRIHIPKCGL